MTSKLTLFGVCLWFIGVASLIHYQKQKMIIKAYVAQEKPLVDLSNLQEKNQLWNYIDENKESHEALRSLQFSELKGKIELLKEKDHHLFMIKDVPASFETVFKATSELTIQYFKKLEEEEKSKLDQKLKEIEISLQEEEQQLLILEKLTTKEEYLKKLEADLTVFKTVSQERLPFEIGDLNVPSAKKYRDLSQNYMQLKNKYKEKHPEMISMKEELFFLKQSILDELEEKIEDAKVQVDQVRNEFKKIKNSEEYPIDTLKNKISEEKAEQEQLFQRLKSISENQEKGISYSIMIEPNYPKLKKSLAYSGIGLLFFLISMMTIGLLDKKIYHPKHVYKTNKDISLLTITPRLSRKESQIPLLTHYKPQSLYSKSMHHVRNRLLNLQPKPCQVVMVTSIGKAKSSDSAFVTNLSISLAQAQKRVLLIDCKFHEQTQHRYFRLRNKGLAQILQEDSAWEESLVKVEVPNLAVLPAGEDLKLKSLYSNHFSELLKQWESHHDFIFLDAPSLSTGEEPILIAQYKTDGVIVTFPYGKIKRNTLKYVKESMNRAGVPLLGVILQDVSAFKTKRWNEV